MKIQDILLNSPIFYKDFYKVNHYEQYLANTTLIFSNLTPRKSRIEGVDKAVFFGLYAVISQLHFGFREYFFKIPKNQIMNAYQMFMKSTLGLDKEWKHIGDLHDLGYLPIAIHALPEGTQVPMRVPCMTIYNTKPEFYWLTNMLETIISCMLWQPCTSATIACQYRQILTKYAYKTSDILDFIDYQAHDFSFRGMSSADAACLSGAAHLLYFKGTDTIPAISFLHKYYGAPLSCGTSVPATEHSVMCAGSKDSEIETFRRLITKIYPSGIVSVVSDTWDLWEVINNYLPALKSEIMARDGKVVIRPDSGDPAEIICGKEYLIFKTLKEAEDHAESKIYDEAHSDCEGSYNCGKEEYSRIYKVSNKYYKITWSFEYGRHDKTYYFIEESKHKSTEEFITSSEEKGLIERLWEIFGGTVNSKGYKQLDPHIGVIYGDSITLDRCEEICKRLQDKGFASTNIVFGVGSYTYQYNTRDTLGWAIKATYAEIDGKGVNLFKDPKTDDGTKKSATGLLKVVRVKGDNSSTLQVQEKVNWDEFHSKDNELKLVLMNDLLEGAPKFEDIKHRAC